MYFIRLKTTVVYDIIIIKKILFFLEVIFLLFE